MALYGHSRHDLKNKEAYSCMVTHGMLLMHDTNTRRHDLNINTHGMVFTQGEKQGKYSRHVLLTQRNKLIHAWHYMVTHGMI
jgi:hypothetical protein